MIITKKKPFDEIKQLIPSGSVYIFGCSECATLCKTGGAEEVQQMKQRLESEGYTVTGTYVLDPACHKKKSRLLLREEMGIIQETDHLLVLACGDGMQVVASLFPEKHVVSGTDTLFLGAEDKRYVFGKRCDLCGTCIAESFNGICPIGRCPKQMLNGPCGGSVDGHCELSKDLPCVWQEIIDKATALDKVEQLKSYRPPHNWAVKRTQDIRGDE
jgi:ferredoxin